ncbi:pyruvate, phosphate dikinase [Treponema pedis]|uniref:Pyruvate, phosphate dikinase n=1 Tax=Treponema pedis str. T A4 TaxID=1291379 RepID=S6A7V9_9SPIR|nr:pyruvate, phosphate dikinase [Treponema pedis]AGT42764.1 pyruvate phosphate dikinase [Treponema pedis str. T A4]
MAKSKYVYFFGDGRAEGNGTMKDVLGGKGAGLAEMTAIGLPVPAGFTITTEVCEEYYKNNRKYPAELKKQVEEYLSKLEKTAGKKLGDKNDPLLVSVRSGAPVSMPGMMETILNLGLNDESVKGLAKKTGNLRFALDAYRRFILMYGSTAMNIERDKFDKILNDIKEKKTRKRLNKNENIKISDTDVNEAELKEVIDKSKALYKKEIKTDFPQKPLEQLWGAISAVFGSWMSEKAVTYRRVENITGIRGTAVNVMQMVFGNKGNTSGTGVCFTRDPNSGKNEFYGEYLFNAQGEDVVAGIRTPIKLDVFEKEDPKAYKRLCEVRKILEKHYKDMQDMEFTVEEGKLYMLQCRTGKRLPAAAFQMAVDMVEEKLITKEQAVARIKASDIEGVFYKTLDYSKTSEIKASHFADGIAAVPGAACGKICLSAARAEEMRKDGNKVILVRHETSPEDVGGMHAAEGILTATGGKTSHAAVVARGWGKCCIVGCEKLSIDYDKKEIASGGVILKEGDFITLDGTKGSVYKGELTLINPKPPAAYKKIMEWVNEIRKIHVRTNADTPEDAKIAIGHGAEGIGLCRTEHMFFSDENRILAIREMIIAETKEAREKALKKLLPYQTRDFEGIFKAMNGYPVTIRLIDPPLHEFVPHDKEGQQNLAERLNISFASVKNRVEQLTEANPMLGHRGCRLSITYPEILEMQVTAIISAACSAQKKGIKVLPEIMIPLTIDAKEFKILEKRVREVADDIIEKKAKDKKLKYMVGTMIETPRAALLADKIAEYAEFFSFGTNDLTQMTIGISRDDAGKFLPEYVDETKAGVFKADPFQSLDQEGVGMLVDSAIQKGRNTRKDLEIGVCGEHGGDLNSVKFFCRAGMDYVSASPLRVPIARLAAAHAEIEKKATAAQPVKRDSSVKADTVKKAQTKKAAVKSDASQKKAPVKKSI